MAKVRFEWRPDFESKIRAHLERGLVRGAMLLEEAMIKKTSTGQPVRRTAGGYLVGLNPSSPGQPPHVLSGRFRQSLTRSAITRSGMGRIGIKVGTNIVYGARLEWGFVGRDSLGRNYSQAARPWARPSLHENFAEIGRRIAKG